MTYKIDHDYHIHTYLSSCSRDPEQNIDMIGRYARENKLDRIVITDHFWDENIECTFSWYKPQDFAHISKIKPLPKDGKTKFMFGCETEIRHDMLLGIPRERFDDFDFVVIPTTHLHMDGFTITYEDDKSKKRRSELWLSRLSGLLDMDLPFTKIGIPHLCCHLVCQTSMEDLCEVMDGVSTYDMADVFEKAARRGVGIELNRGDMSFEDKYADCILRPFRIARSCGCKFYLGSDAHKPHDFSGTKDIFERAIRLLDLRESDKFHITK